MITISAGTRCVTLPHSLSFVHANARQQATKISLAGNAIQQYSEKSTDAGTLAYSGPISSTDAATLDAMQYAGGTCTVSDGSKAWEAVIDAQFQPTMIASRKQATINFNVIRQIV